MATGKLGVPLGADIAIPLDGATLRTGWANIFKRLGSKELRPGGPHRPLATAPLCPEGAAAAGYV